MNELKASFAFLPWIRRGLSVTGGGGATVDGRLTIIVEPTFGPGRQVPVALKLAGAGEVTGLDQRVVIRSWPPANVHDAEPNYFPMVEFDQCDLPWRYTPAAAPDDERLQPWLCLIVLKDEEIGALVPPSATRPLPVVTVSGAPLPLLDQAWAWAHVQVVGVDNITPAEAAEFLSSEPQRLVSRILCPRRLEPKTRYTVFLVPTFESGRRAGIAQPGDAPAPALAPAWTSQTQTIQLPVYYQWVFSTGVSGDFEELVKRLKPARLPATVGTKPMNVTDPGADLPLAASEPLDLEGALQALSAESTPWPVEEQAPFVEALGQLLNRPAELLQGSDGERAVAPPLYGQWPAAQDRLAPGQEPIWFQEVNSDPRWRVAAGLGTQVIQANQRQLMAGAWQQAPGLADINDKLRLSQLARELATRLHKRHLDDDDEELVLQVTAPVHGRVRANPVTVAATVQKSPIVEGAISTGWRRVTRPNGAIGRRQKRPSGERSQLLRRLNEAQLSPAPLPPTPSGMATPSRTGGTFVPDFVNATSVARLRTLARWLPLVGALVDRLADRLELRLTERRLAVRESALSRANIEALPARTRFAISESELLGGRSPTPQPPVRPAGDTPTSRAFRGALASMQDQIDAELVPADKLEKARLGELRERLVSDLHPNKTIGETMHRRLQIADHLQWQFDDPLEPLLARPDFPQPMFQALAELSQAWLLPGLAQVPANSAGLVTTNQRFVEAYMLGLNHEMSRELLWREYPTDQRATYFRHFWDLSGFVPANGQAPAQEQMQDIPPIHRWRADAALGGNSAGSPAADGQLVLLLRGDVIHRYPNLMVYAARAAWNAEQKRELDSEEQQPIFSGTLKPDVAFFGFNLTAEQARGDSDTPGQGDPGWFFVLQEQPSEPRFGLDIGEAGDNPPGEWPDLHWGHLVTQGQGLSAVDYIDLAASLPATSSIDEPDDVAWHIADGTQGAHLAYITLQQPVRVAIHAADMLPF